MQVLGLFQDLSTKDVCVQLGCPEIVEDVEKLLKLYVLFTYTQSFCSHFHSHIIFQGTSFNLAMVKQMLTTQALKQQL